MKVIRVREPGTVESVDFQEITHRYHELESLLAECPDMPADHALKREFQAIKALMERPVGLV